MKGLWAAALAALLSFALTPTARAEIPQILMDRLAELPAERVSSEQLSAAADRAQAQWRGASPETAIVQADVAARLAHRAGRSAEAVAAAQAILEARGVDAASVANAQLIMALEAVATNPSAEAQLAQALDGAPAANAVLRSRAARTLAIAHMRRDEQIEALVRWRQAETAAADISDERTYDLEVALLGRAAAHGYQGESAQGVIALETIFQRMRSEMARLAAVREMSAGEHIYATAVAWRSAFSIHRTEVSRDWSYVQVGSGSGSADAEGQPFCRGNFRFRPRPHFPIGAVFGRWSGASVLRLATDAEGRVIHAEAVAAVPPTPLFSRVSLDVAPEWRFVPERDERPGETCRLQAEGLLVSWRFEDR